MLYGYARVSTLGQSLKSQEELLKNAGVDNKNIFHEKYTGTKTNRPEFTKVLAKLQKGDTLVVAKLDRLARNTREALNVIQDLQERQVKIDILNMGIIDNTSIGKFTVTMLLAVAEMERDTIVSRTEEGKKYAKAHNPNFREGRKTRLQGKNKEQYKGMYEYRQTHTAQETADTFNVSIRTVFNVCKAIKESK